MLDNKGIKSVLSNYKDVRTLSLDFAIMKGALEPGNRRPIFGPVTTANLPCLEQLVLRYEPCFDPTATEQKPFFAGLTHILLRLHNLTSVKIILHNDGRMGKVRRTLEQHAISKWSPESLPFPDNADRALSMMVPHPEDLDAYVGALVSELPKRRTFECVWTESGNAQDADLALHYRKHIDLGVRQFRGDLCDVPSFDKERLIRNLARSDQHLRFRAIQVANKIKHRAFRQSGIDVYARDERYNRWYREWAKRENRKVVARSRKSKLA